MDRAYNRLLRREPGEIEHALALWDCTRDPGKVAAVLDLPTAAAQTLIDHGLDARRLSTERAYLALPAWRDE